MAIQLLDHLDEVGTAAGARLGTAFLDLVAAALAECLDHRQRDLAATPQDALLARIHADIEQRLGDPTLTPRTIAADHFISVRYLYKLFETQPVGVAAWIRRRRLERCGWDLLDPALRARPVSAIGARWGLTDATSFSRAFQAAYGVPPARYRRIGQALDARCS